MSKICKKRVHRNRKMNLRWAFKKCPRSLYFLLLKCFPGRIKKKKRKEKKKKLIIVELWMWNMEHGLWRSWDFRFPQAYYYLIANKTEEKYEKFQTLTRSKLFFLMLRSILLCIKGSRSVSKDSVVLDNASLTCFAAGLFELDIVISLFGVLHFESQVPALILRKLIWLISSGIIGFSSMFFFKTLTKNLVLHSFAIC